MRPNYPQLRNGVVLVEDQGDYIIAFDLRDALNEPTVATRCSRGRLPKIWAEIERRMAPNLTIQDIGEVFDSCGVRWSHYCAMD